MTGVSSVRFEEADSADADELARLALEEPGPTWSAAHFQAACAAERGRHVIVARGPLGLLAFCALACAADEVEVHNLAVRPDARRQGLGRALLRHALTLGRARGARRAFLEVRAGNKAARALYAACGFALDGRRRDYYSEPREDALLLVRNLEIEGGAC